MSLTHTRKSGSNGVITSSKAQIPEGWRQVRLGDVAEVTRGTSWSREQESSLPSEETVPVVRIGNVQREGFKMGDTLHLLGVSENERKRRAVTSRTLVMVGSNGNRNRVGNIFLAVPEVYGHLLASFLIGINPNADVSEHFLSSSMRSEQIQSLITESTTGSTGLKNLSLNWLRSLPILLPPLPEQRAIAAVLDSIDEAIEGAESVIGATEQLRDSLLHQLLTRGVPGWHTEWKDVPGLGTIPADWEVVRLGEVAEVTSGIAMGPHRVPRSNPRPYLTVANVQADHVTIGERRFMELTEAEYRSRTLRTGDVVLVEGHAQIMQLGRAAIVPPDADGFTFQNHLFRVRPGERCNAIFVCAYVNSGSGRRYFGSFGGTTSGLNTVSAANVKALPLPLPPISEQQLIATALHGVDKTIERARTELDGLQLLKESTADALLTGRVRVAMDIC